VYSRAGLCRISSNVVAPWLTAESTNAFAREFHTVGAALISTFSRGAN